MHNILNDLDIKEKVDLDLEYKEALLDPNFKQIVKSLKLDPLELKNIHHNYKKQQVLILIVNLVNVYLIVKIK